MISEVAKQNQEELSKIPKLIENLNLALEEVQKSNDRERVEKRILPWLKGQIQNIQAWGGDTNEVLQIQIKFQDFLSTKIDKMTLPQLRQPLTEKKQEKTEEDNKMPEKTVSAIELLPNILTDLNWENIENLEISKLSNYFGILKKAAEAGTISISEIAGQIIPVNQYSLNLFYSDNYIKQVPQKINELKGKNDNYSNAVRSILTCCQSAKENQLKHHIVFDFFVKTFGENINFRKESYLFSEGIGENIPSKSAINSNHQDAIDIFFPVTKEGEKEKGPNILSFSAGMVIATADDWEGGETKETYLKGGLSPKAGNGVLIFNPTKNQYFYYAHLYNIKVKKGDIVKAGDILGCGGNSGINARKNHHGKHLHFEVHDFNPLDGTNKVKIASRLRNDILALKGTVAKLEAMMY